MIRIFILVLPDIKKHNRDLHMAFALGWYVFVRNIFGTNSCALTIDIVIGAPPLETPPPVNGSIVEDCTGCDLTPETASA